MLLWILGIVSTLGLAGTVAAVIVVPGVAIPILQATLKGLLKCKACKLALAAIALLLAGALYGVHVERQRADARINRMKVAADKAAGERDAGIRADLERHYRPQISALEQRSKALEGEVDKYAQSLQTKPAVEAKKPAAAPGKCTLGAGPLRLRKPL